MFNIESNCAANSPGVRENPTESYSCNGNMVLTGDTKAVVFEKCGTPQRVDQGCIRRRRGNFYCWDIWIYQPNTTYFPCYMSFRSDIVWSIRIGSRFD